MASILPFEQEAAESRRAQSPQALVKRLERASIRYLKPLLAEMLDQTDDAFFHMAEKAGNNEQQARHFEAMREVRRRREEIERTFARRLDDGFRAFLQAGIGAESAAPGPASADELQLMDDSAMEESVALGNVANKVRNRHGQEVEALHQRLEHLYRAERLPEGQDPLSPRTIAEAFGAASRALGGTVDTRLVLFKLFDQHVAGNLLPLYEAANRMLAEAGVLPQLHYKVSRPAGEGRARPRAAPGGAGGGPPRRPSTRDEDAETDLLATLRQILGQTGPSLGAQGQGEPGGSGTATATTAVVGDLSGLQRQQSQVQPVAGGAQVVVLSGAVLREQIPNAQSMGAVDDALIDVVAMLFEMLLAEEGLPNAARAQIARLQIPVLKVALLDKEFFARKAHPARALLDALLRVGMGVDETDGEEDPALALITDVVDTLLADFDTDVSVFESLAQRLEGFLAEQARQEAAAEEAARCEAAEREARESAREDAVAVAEDLLADGVPDAVGQILGGPWLEVMARARLEGDTAGWEAAVAFAERLVWSVRPKRDGTERRELAVAIPELLATLRQELCEIDVGRERVEALIAGLEPLHLAGLNPDRTVSDADVTAEVPELGLDDVVVLGERRRALGPQDEHLETAWRLRVGDWLRLIDGDGRSRRLKVAWKSNLLEELMLTNWRRQTVEMTMRELAADLRCGAAQVLPSGPVFDRTLARLLKRIQGD